MRKPNKFIRHYGFELEFEGELTDQELRLFHIYKLLTDWDKNHTSTYGCAEITLRQLKDRYLSSWSLGKVCKYRQSLIKKGWLKERGDGLIEIPGYNTYAMKIRGLKDIQVAENIFRETRIGVQETEPQVQSTEHSAVKDLPNYKMIVEQIAKQKGVWRSTT